MPPDGAAVAELVTLDVKMFYNYGRGGTRGNRAGHATILKLWDINNVPTITQRCNRTSVTRKNTKNVKASVSQWSRCRGSVAACPALRGNESWGNFLVFRNLPTNVRSLFRVV